jgi:hypothetical protein
MPATIFHPQTVRMHTVGILTSERGVVLIVDLEMTVGGGRVTSEWESSTVEDLRNNRKQDVSLALLHFFWQGCPSHHIVSRMFK